MTAEVALDEPVTGRGDHQATLARLDRARVADGERVEIARTEQHLAAVVADRAGVLDAGRREHVGRGAAVRADPRHVYRRRHWYARLNRQRRYGTLPIDELPSVEHRRNGRLVFFDADANVENIWFAVGE